LSGGLGFWRIDRLALSAELPARPTATVLRPTTAVGPNGADQRAALAATDGVYDALEQVGDALHLEFELPPRPPGTSRFAFLSVNGYYNVHPPVQRQWLPGTLRAVRDRPGSLARLALDLARAYAAPVEGTGAASPAGSWDGVEICARVYRPRRARESPLFRLVEQHLEEFLRVYPERFAKQHGPLRPVVERVLRGFLTCGLVEHGFARLWCGTCRTSVLCPSSCES